MKIRVRLYALAKQRAGRELLDMELPDGVTVRDLRAVLAAEVPELAGLMRQVMFAVGTGYAGDSTVIPPGADVACIPPVSGG